MLSPLEIKLVQSAADGETSAQTATKLHYSLWTVKVYWRSICPKLGAKNRTHAVAIAWRAGLIK